MRTDDIAGVPPRLANWWKWGSEGMVGTPHRFRGEGHRPTGVSERGLFGEAAVRVRGRVPRVIDGRAVLSLLAGADGAARGLPDQRYEDLPAGVRDVDAARLK
jgi:hypothetical protein